MMGLIRDRKCHQDTEVNECHKYNLELEKCKTSKRGRKQRSALTTNKWRQNISPFFICRFIAISMVIRFVVMVTIWTPIFINSLQNQEVSIPSKDGFCDPCPENWLYYRNHCYQFFNETRTWYESQASCVSQNSSLLKIYNRVEQDFFKLVKSYHWMGLTKLTTDGSWWWEDGSILLTNQLTVVDVQNGTCVVYGSNFKGYTENCHNLNTYICMRRAG